MQPSHVNQLLLSTNPDITQSLQLIENYLVAKGLISKAIKPAEIDKLPSNSVLISHYESSDENSHLDALLGLKKDITHILVLHDRLTNQRQLSEPLKSIIARCDVLAFSSSDEIDSWGKSDIETMKVVQFSLPKPLPNVSFAHPSQGFRNANEPCNLTFVGDITSSNEPLVLLEALHILRSMQQQNICLQWFSNTSQPACLAQVQKSIIDLGLTNAVQIIDLENTKTSVSDMLHKTDIYTCLSASRNTGLLCAAQLKIPVVALHTPEQDSVYNQIGLRTLKLDAEHYAATIQQVIINPRLRSTLTQTALNACQQYQPSTLYSALQQALADINVYLPKTDQLASPGELKVRIEGPYDSSYSLAIVNRELARALYQLNPDSVGLYATEGGGDYVACQEFLEHDPEIASIAQQGLAQRAVETSLRLLYPPRVSGMQGTYNGLNLYGWEESYVPSTYIDDFNQHLQFSTTMSSYVSRTLRDNGCNIPLFTTGIGVDHILHSEADDSALPTLPNTLRLLHISSCFPRKGVDVLLTAYGTAFSGADKVCLIIKTFINPHHDIALQLQEWRDTLNDAPEVILINEDLPPSAIRALYQAADVLVGPSRGEGFGLPMAEAMLHDLPVITTGYGGQTDFCTDQTAWLIDYEFSRAESHISGNNSVWVEPCAKHLTNLLESFYQAYQQEGLTLFSQDKVKAAKSLINQKYRWQAVAQRCQKAISTLPLLPVLNPQPKLAIVTSWNSKCGIATYSKLLMQPALSDTLVLANKEENLICEDEVNVIRCWQSVGKPEGESLAELFSAIINNHIEQVVIQFNFSFFELDSLKNLLEKLHQKGIQTFLTLHSTADVYWNEERKTLQDLQPQIHHVERVFVHSIADLNQLKRFGLINNVSLFPHGVKQPENAKPELSSLPESHEFVTTATQQQKTTVLASYGFLLPHKGIDILIEAFRHFLQKQPNSHLLLITAQYPAEVSHEHLLTCQQLIAEYQLAEKITLVSDFLTDEQSQAWLSLADCIVYPYQQTQESSSAAVRWGLALQKPVFCTPLAIFDDVGSVVHFLPGTNAQQIADGIYAGLENTNILVEKALSQAQWLKENDWERLSQRLKHILSGLFLEKSYKEQSKF